MSETEDITQSIPEHLGQFSLHVLLVFATGLTAGSERAVIPVLGRHVLGRRIVSRQRIVPSHP